MTADTAQFLGGYPNLEDEESVPFLYNKIEKKTPVRGHEGVRDLCAGVALLSRTHPDDASKIQVLWRGIDDNGYYTDPIPLDDVQDAMRIFQERPPENSYVAVIDADALRRLKASSTLWAARLLDEKLNTPADTAEMDEWDSYTL